MQRFSRRRFLQWAAVSAGAAYVATHHKNFLPLAQPEEPVVILGAGAAGLAAAYELQKRHVPYVIYEASSRYGGRVLTQENFNTDNMFCELGAELIDSHHETLFGLTRELGLEVEKLKQEGTVNQAFYFNNRFLMDKDILPEFLKLAQRIGRDVNAMVDGQKDFYVNYRNHTEVAKHFDFMDLESYLNNIKNVDPYVIDMVRVAYVCEFGLEAHEQSSLNLLLLMSPESNEVDFYGSSDEAWRIKGGNSKLMQALAGKVQNQNEIQYSHRLTHIQEKNSKVVMQFDNKGVSKEVTAAKVICTIPFPILKGIEGVDKLALSPRKNHAIKNFKMGANSKVITGFKERFWSQTFQGQLYTQLNSQIFWDSSRNQPGTSGILTNYLGGDQAKQASETYFDRGLKDFSSLFPKANQYISDKKAIANWSQNPFAQGSYACPTPGSYTTYLGSLSEPELDHKIYFAGEHVSEQFLGYLNGALESGQVAARAIVQSLS